MAVAGVSAELEDRGDKPRREKQHWR